VDGAIVSEPGAGELLVEETRELRIKAVRPELDFLKYVVAPAYDGPGPHFHKRHVDSFYVLEGELEFTIGEETVHAAAGAYVLVPPGVVHAFTNPGPGRARFLNVHAPETGFADYMRARDRGEGASGEDYDVWDVG
jgi:mannose-6-phosphate isomerase-like protein (cupin superfamily)